MAEVFIDLDDPTEDESTASDIDAAFSATSSGDLDVVVHSVEHGTFSVKQLDYRRFRLFWWCDEDRYEDDRFFEAVVSGDQARVAAQCFYRWQFLTPDAEWRRI